MTCRDSISAVDLSDETAPEVISTLELTHGTAYTWDRDGVLVASNGKAITVIDTSDPGQPVEQALVELPIDDAMPDWPNTSSWHLSDDLLAAKVQAYDLLRLYDITDLESPVHVSTFLYSSGKGVGLRTQLHPDEPVLYVGTQGDGLRVVDLSDPSQPVVELVHQAIDVDPEDDPQQVDSCTGLGRVDGVLYESGSYGWSDWDGAEPWDGARLSYVRAWDISDPLDPQLIEEWQDDGVMGTLGSIQDAGDFAIVQIAGYGLRAFDPAVGPFEWIGGYLAAGQTTDVELAGDVAHISGYLGGGITAVDISDPDNPVQVGYAHHGLDTYGLGLHHGPDGTFVYTSGKSTVQYFEDEHWRYTNLTVWDFTDPEQAEAVAWADGDCHLAVDAQDDLLWADCNLWDISDSLAPVHLNEACIANGEAAARSGDLLVYGTGRSALSGSLLDSGADSWALVIYDLTVPSAPVMVGMLELADTSGGMLSTNLVLRGESAWFVNGVGVVQVDISDPRQPVELGRLVMDGYDPESLDVHGDFLYVQCQHSDLFVYDIADGLDQAVELGHLGTHVAEITKLHGHQLLSATANGLYLTDVPRSADTPAGSLTVRWHAATDPAGDPGRCDTGLDDTGDGDPGRCGRCGCASGGRGALSMLFVLFPGLIWMNRRRRAP